MKKWLKPLALAIATVGFMTAPQVDAADDPIRTRVAVMKELAGHAKAIGAYLKGNKDPGKAAALGTAGDIEFRAMAMASLAKRLPSFFPKGTSAADMPGKTRAKPEIWSMSGKFAAAAARLENASRKVEMAAATGEKDKIAAAMKGFGKASCGGCHSDFRGPELKKTM